MPTGPEGGDIGETTQRACAGGRGRPRRGAADDPRAGADGGTAGRGLHPVRSARRSSTWPGGATRETRPRRRPRKTPCACGAADAETLEVACVATGLRCFVSREDGAR